MTTMIQINGEVRDAASLTLPADRLFRDAWALSGTAVETDMAKARDIHRDRLRAERAPRLADLDAAWFRADETNDEAAQAEISAIKRKLRDVTNDQRIDAAKTPDDLAALTLNVLIGD